MALAVKGKEDGAEALVGRELHWADVFGVELGVGSTINADDARRRRDIVALRQPIANVIEDNVNTGPAGHVPVVSLKTLL